MMEFERTIVFGDFYDDPDIMLASLSEKGLVRYVSSEQYDIIEQIKAFLNQPFAPPLEAMVIPQAQPVRVIFLGDFPDRYNKELHTGISIGRWDYQMLYKVGQCSIQSARRSYHRAKELVGNFPFGKERWIT